MLQYIKHLIQLLLAPSRGWEDVSESAVPADEIQRRGFYPWTGIVAASCLLRLFYDRDITFTGVIMASIAAAGALFVSVFIARIFLDITLPRYIDSKINVSKVNIFAVYLTGIMGLYSIIGNATPASMTFLNFLPVLSLLIIFRSMKFLGIKDENAVSFIALAAVAVIVIPVGVSVFFNFII